MFFCRFAQRKKVFLLFFQFHFKIMKKEKKILKSTENRLWLRKWRGTSRVRRWRGEENTSQYTFVNISLEIKEKYKKIIYLKTDFLLLLLILHTRCGTHTGECGKTAIAAGHWRKYSLNSIGNIGIAYIYRAFLSFLHSYDWLFFVGSSSSLLCWTITWTWKLFSYAFSQLFKVQLL